MRSQPHAVREAVLREVERLYRETDTPNAELARMMNVGVTRFNRIREAGGWPLREPGRSSRFRAALRAGAVPEGGTAPGSAASIQREGANDNLGPADLARWLRGIVVRRIALLESGAAGRERDPERSARTLASLTRTLVQLSAIAPPEPAPQECLHGTDRPPRSVDELRDELRRHMLRLRQEYRLRRRARNTERA